MSTSTINRRVVYTTTTESARQRTTSRVGIAAIVRATGCRVCLDPTCFGGESAHPWEDQ
jgi:hypothetical protein